ncbi:hypothetical protein [Spirobacillus cienkowskii]|jgi:hypothetical protein|uniref:Uncharacterized protein n=1 Tax=Spirobacillus cienkowskii TaxID=495820 RepID=A0A369KSM8_9BACT|nr:MAG: hypothetical protein DCC88_05210 [Spirobacillus cienkowskii]
MSQIFRIATCQAIREIIEESALEGRFGLILTNDGVEKIANRVVDLFEMTLELRAKTHEMFAGKMPSQDNQQNRKTRSPFFHSDEQSPFPRSKNAAEIYDFGSKKTDNLDSIPLAPNQDVKLPRKRFGLSLEEREKLRR